MAENEKAQVLVMSPLTRARRELASRIAAAGHAVWTGTQGPAAVEAVICHVPGSGMGALALLEDLRARHTDACLILAGRDHGAERTAAMLRAGAFDYLTTPIAQGRLEESLREGLEIRRSFLQVRELSDKLKAANAELAKERDSLESWNRSLVLVNDLSQSFAGTLEAEEIVRMVGDRLAAILRLELLGIAWTAPRRAWIHSVEAAEEAVQGMRNGLLNGAPAVEAPAADEAEVLEVPLKVAKEQVGLLRLQRRRGDPFDTYQEELVKAVATPLALALRNAEAHQEVQSQAMTDGLTNLLNRRAFSNILAREFRETERYQTPLCLIMMDVDHFKSVNDRFGHQTGDRLLKEVADLIGQAIRTVDVATRYGGEEFAIILPRTEIAQARILANRIRELLEQQVFLADGLRLGLTVSMGLAQAPHPQVATADELVATADEALYRAKAGGRNRVEPVPEGAPLEPAFRREERTGVGNAGMRC